MNTAPTAADAALAYRDLNRALLLIMALALAWVFGLHAISMLLGRPLHTCASRALFDTPCPLCGLTRGIAALATADIARASRYHPFSLPVALALLAELIYRACGAWPRMARKLARFRSADARLHALALAAFLGYAAGFYLRPLF